MLSNPKQKEADHKFFAGWEPLDGGSNKGQTYTLTKCFVDSFLRRIPFFFNRCFIFIQSVLILIGSPLWGWMEATL